MRYLFDSAKNFVEFNTFLSYMEVKYQVRLVQYFKIFCVFDPGEACGAKFVVPPAAIVAKKHELALRHCKTGVGILLTALCDKSHTCH